MRDRLVELLYEAEGTVNNDLPTVEQIADYLLGHGTGRIGTTDWLTKGIDKEKLAKEREEALAEYEAQKKRDLAREIFAEIEKLIGEALEIEDKRGRNAWGDGDTSSFMTHQYAEEKLECLQTALTELEKKYDSEKEG